MASDAPIIELKVYTFGMVTLACADSSYRFNGLGCEEEVVEEPMLREVMQYMDKTGDTWSDDSLYDVWLRSGNRDKEALLHEL